MHLIRGLTRDLLVVGPRGDDHHHAVRVASGLAIPGTVLVLAGRTDLLVFAVFGSFIGMYGRGRTRWSRLRHQLFATALIGAGAAIGVLLAAIHARPVLLVAVETGFAAAGSLFADRAGLRPGGPFFGLFALGALASVPACAAAPLPGLSLFAATALLCVLLGTLHADTVAPTAEVRAFEPGESVRHAGRYVLAVALAGAIGVGWGVAHANWAMAAAAVPLAAQGARGHVLRGIHRVLGTFVGLAATAVLLLPHLPAALLGVLVLLLLFPTELFMARNYALALGFFTPLIMVMTDLAAPADPVRLLLDRGTDTILGVGVGICVAVATRPRTTPGPSQPELPAEDRGGVAPTPEPRP
ncbi:FUSC family protein [Nocardia sp. NPDC004860]|uniref:FUSC family protein n=1 Tax=Nocardia sp. NPDC004860 TaxID=3154557 RepID=UPI0033BBFE52